MSRPMKVILKSPIRNIVVNAARKYKRHLRRYEACVAPEMNPKVASYEF